MTTLNKTMTVKEVALEIKEIIFGGHDVNLDSYIQDLSTKSNVNFDDIKNMYNNIAVMFIDSKSNKMNHAKRKIWGDGEDSLLLQYVPISLAEGVKNKETVFKELTEILDDRNTWGSIQVRYYNLLSKTNDIDNSESEEQTIETITEEPINIQNTDTPKEKREMNNGMDLLDTVVSIVDNVDSAGIDVNGLFNSLLELTNRAVNNTKAVEDKSILEGKLAFLESELGEEKRRNELLQLEVSNIVAEFNKLKGEIEYFNGLNGQQKLKQFSNFNNKIKYIVDKFGGVIAVGVENVG